MKVWVLMEEIDHEGDRFRGVFADQETAERVAAVMQETEFFPGVFEVYERELGVVYETFPDEPMDPQPGAKA